MTTVADLYTQILGREPDAGGLAYWQQQFGSNVDPAEAATFLGAAKAELANRTSEEQQVLAPKLLDDMLAESNKVTTSAPAAITSLPTTVEDVYKQFYGGTNAGTDFWKQHFGGNNITEQQAAMLIDAMRKDNPNINTGLTVEDIYNRGYLEDNPNLSGIDFWKQHFGSGPLTLSQLSQLTSSAHGINTDTDGGGLFGTGIGPDVSWTSIRDPLEAAGVVVGNYFLPGSSLVTGKLVSEGAKQQLATPVGMLANIAAGAAGGYAGNTANYGNLLGTSASAPSNAVLDAQFVSADAAQLAQQGLSQAQIEQTLTSYGVDAFTAADAAQLALQGIKPDQMTGLLSQSSGGNPIFSSTGMTGGVSTGSTPTTPSSSLTDTIKNLTPSQISTLTKAGINIAGLLAGGAAVKGITGALTPSTGTLSLNPQNRAGISSGSAQYSPEYYQAIQSKYNQMMPQQPRDVTTELKNWYETKYAPTATITPKVV